jgi:hypothetical protein
MIRHLNSIGLQSLDRYIIMVYTILLKYAKSGDSLYSDKIKFILRDEDNAFTPLSAIVEIKIVSSNKPKITDLIPGGVKKAAKKGVPLKTVYEFDYYDKSPYLPFFSESNCKILCFSQNFEKMIRYNILECVNKLFKIEDLEKDNFMIRLEESYRERFITPFISELADDLNKDIITYDFDLVDHSSG